MSSTPPSSLTTSACLQSSVSTEDTPAPSSSSTARQWRRKWWDRVACWMFRLAAWIGVAVVAWLLVDTARRGIPWLTSTFFTEVMPSRYPLRAGFLGAMGGSLFVISLVIPISFLVAVATSLYLEEYAKNGRVLRFIQLNLDNLAAIPSVVYGILGFTLFVQALQLGRSVLSAALTLVLLVLPIIIVAAREAIRSVPDSLRQASYAMGATHWQTVRGVVLPSAFPGIVTGMLLAIARALGETAPLVLIGAATFLTQLSWSPLDNFAAMPMQIYYWVSQPEEGFHHLAAAGVIVLLSGLFLLNVVALFIRERSRGGR